MNNNKLCVHVKFTRLVSVFRGVVFGGDNETPPLPSTSVYSLNNVHHLLWIFQCPVNLVVVTSSQIDHDVFITIEEHDCTWVVELVHFVEVGHFVDVHQKHGSEVFHLC